MSLGISLVNAVPLVRPGVGKVTAASRQRPGR